MNTPLNDALTREQLIAFLDGSGTIDGVSYGERHPTGRGLYWWRKYLPILANTPESSAAQGAMGDARKPFGYFIMTGFEQDQAVQVSDAYKDDDEVFPLFAAQPSDATAQPIMNISDIEILELADLNAVGVHEGDGVLTSHLAYGTEISHVVIKFARELLANTAQGKPEQCPTCRGNDANAPCAYPSCGMTGCLRDKRLAAKKG